MKHLLAIEELSRQKLEMLLENAASMVEISDRELKKVPALRGKTVINLFFEASTRTRASFEIAAKRLSADVINFSPSTSSVTKGETLIDTARTLEAMNPDIIVVRHASSGVPWLLARHLSSASIVNAGDGMHEHPTQALLDLLTLRQHFGGKPESIRGLTIALVGDLRHSRVARSNIWAHLLLGNEVRLVGPPTLVPPEFSDPVTFAEAPLGDARSPVLRTVPERRRVKVYHRLEEGIEGADVVMCLRMQLERQEQHFVPSLEEYSREYGVNESILKKYAARAVVMHPGPVNRGVELSSAVYDGPRSLIDKQVSNGIAVRMGVLFTLAAGSNDSDSKSANSKDAAEPSSKESSDTKPAGASLEKKSQGSAQKSRREVKAA